MKRGADCALPTGKSPYFNASTEHGEPATEEPNR
jgi:hypothetical protein